MNTFQFANPEFLHGLWLIPLLVLLYIYMYRRKSQTLRRLGNPTQLKRLMPERSLWRPHVKFTLFLLSLALLIVALARPLYGMSGKADTTRGIELAVMVDVSNSMLAQDVSPNRLEQAKLLLSTLTDRMQNDQISLGVFAGEAYPLLPLTSDYDAAETYINSLSPEMVTLQGTNLPAAISLAEKSFSDQEEVGKAILIITDGETHVEGAEEAAKEAAKQGMKLFVIGVGTTSGAPIPTAQGNLLDENGREVHTALNEQMCRQLAQAGKGQYIHVDNTSDAERELNNDLTKLQKGDMTSVIYSAYDEQFQAVGILIILLLIIEVCIMEARNPLLRNIKFFKKTPFKNFK